MVSTSSSQEVQIGEVNAVAPKKQAALHSANRIPSYCYSIMTLQQLKKLLQDANLPQDGERNVLIKRHKEYAVRYNANLDSSNPGIKKNMRY